MQANSNQLPPYFLLIVPTVIVGFFCLISYLSSVLCGWHKLAQRFTAQSPPYGETKTAGPFPYTVYTRFWAHYSSCIRMTAASDALYMSVLFFLRIGHPPLRIPWSEVQISRTKYLWVRFVLLTLGNEERLPMRIPERMASKLGLLDRIANGSDIPSILTSIR
jgi:hypothetical protein